jgi:fructose-1,6-bisphosphatase/sedoheptulose 1,7-bisphosphatase-like protein
MFLINHSRSRQTKTQGANRRYPLFKLWNLFIDSGSLTCIMDICLEKGNYDAIIGTYGAPEGLIGAVIAKATGSEFKAIIRPHEDKHLEKWIATGRQEEEILRQE